MTGLIDLKHIEGHISKIGVGLTLILGELHMLHPEKLFLFPYLFGCIVFCLLNNFQTMFPFMPYISYLLRSIF